MRGIFERKKPVEQTDNSEKLEYELQSRPRPERNIETEDKKPVNQEQIKTGELSETREELDKVYEKQEADSEETEEQKKMSAEEFFKEAKSEEKNIELSVIGRTAETVSNTGKSQEARNEIAERKILEVMKALGGIGDDLENIKENIKTILDVGAGWGENLRDLVKGLGAEKGIAIDNKTVFSESVKSDKKVKDKLTMINGDAVEEMKRLENNATGLGVAVALLQGVDRKNKIKILEEMGRVSELVVIVDELKRDGLGGFRDLFINKLYNAGMGKYEVLKEEDWNEIFKEAGLIVVEEVFNKFGKNDFVAVLKKAEEKVEE